MIPKALWLKQHEPHVYEVCMHLLLVLYLIDSMRCLLHTDRPAPLLA
jgi:hypothetical protein